GALDLGSGGGSIEGSAGDGGGRIEIEAGAMVVAGQILSDGGNAIGRYGGGGSGGAIFLRVVNGDFSGNGVVRARGGLGGVLAPAGGGGRIAIVGHGTNSFTGTLGRAGTIFVQASRTDGSLFLD